MSYRRSDHYGYQKKGGGKLTKFAEEENDEADGEKEEKSDVKNKAPSAKDYHKDSKLKQWRMIVRNLPFKTTKEDLQNVCSKFGPFTDIILPPSKKMPKSCAGFAFIQFKAEADANKAKEFFNQNKFKGRSVAADWAIPKDTFETTSHEEREKLKQKVKLEKEENEKKPDTKDEESSDDESSDDDMSDEEVSDDESASENADEDMDVEESPKKKNVKDNKKKKNQNDLAIEEQRVVFLRNVSFDTDTEGLKAAMAQFGTVQLALICKFHESGHSKGTAFVHFSTPEEAAKCVEASEEGNLTIDERQINAILAVPREKANEMEKEKLTKTPADKRNLRLLRFGIIREGTSAANGMSKEDAAKRVRLAEATKKKLENLHMFVSPVRLVIHNLPPNMTNDRLKTLCREAAGPQAFVNECRIWKDKDRLNAKGEAKSRGFAFVCFTEHKHALACLQKLNNNAKTFTNEKRPIVEFSVENLAALQAKERRVTNAKGEKVSFKEVNEKVRKQVQESIGQVHHSGMKFLPKFLGKKMRHRDMSKSKQKRMGVNKKKDQSKAVPKTKKGGVQKADGKKSGKNKKVMTKYLALSS